MADELRLVGPFASDSGYANLARAALRTAILAGYEVQAIESDYKIERCGAPDGSTRVKRLYMKRPKFAEPLAPCVADEIKAAIKTRVSHKAPTLFVQIVESLQGWNEFSSGPRIGWTMQESDRMNPEWAFALGGVDLVLAPSRFVLDTFRRDAPQVCTQLLPLPVDDRLWSVHGNGTGFSRRNLAAFIFFSAFTTIPRKGWPLMMQAFAEEFGGEDVSLIVKPGRVPEVAELARWLNMGTQRRYGKQQIQVLPKHLSAEGLADFYRLADCFVLPSCEGFGLTFIESAMCGTPSMALDKGGSADVVDNETGYPIKSYMAPCIGHLPQIFPSNHLFATAKVKDVRKAFRQAYNMERSVTTSKSLVANETAMARYRPAAIAPMLRESIEQACEIFKGNKRMWPVGIERKPKWGGVFGNGYGDALAVLGNVQWLLRDTDQEQLGIISCATNENVANFLRRQPCIREVRWIKMESNEALMDFANIAGACYADMPDKWMPQLLKGTGIDPADVALTHVHWPWGAWPVYWPRDVVLPDEAWDWAREKAAEWGDFILVQPYSLNSVDYSHHWQWWWKAMRWMIDNSEMKLVFAGVSPIEGLTGPNVVNTIGQCPSMEAVMAMATMAKAVVSTCNGLANWTALGKTPALICANEAIKDPNFFFHKFMATKPNIMIPFEATFDTWKKAATKLFKSIGAIKEPEPEPAKGVSNMSASETSKHRHLVANLCSGNGLDLGSAGDPIVPHAIQVDLPQEQYKQYNSTRPEATIQWRGSAFDLPFKDETCDWLHSSHLLEDVEEWGLVLAEWDRVLKPGGFLIISIPDHERFRAHVARGAAAGVDLENLSHRHEGRVGELSSQFPDYTILMDKFVSDDPNEYSIIFAAKKRQR